MPIIATGIANGGGTSTANSSPYTTASITLPANQLILAFILSSATSTTPPVPSLTNTGGGVTWTPHQNVTFHTIATPRLRLSVFRTVVASNTTSTVSIAITGSPTGCAWAFIAVENSVITGAQGANGIVQQPVGSGNAVTSNTFLTIPGFTAGNGAVVAFGQDNTNITAITPGGAWSELSEVSYATPPTRLQVQWINAPDTTPDASWGATGKNSGGIGVELVLLSTALSTGVVSETIGLTDTAQAARFSTVWDGTITLLAQPHLLDVLTLSDVPLVIETTLGTRTFLTSESITLVDSPTLTGLALACLVAESLTVSDSPSLRGLTHVFQAADSLTLSDTPLVIAVTTGIRSFLVSDTIGLVDTAEAERIGIIADILVLTDVPTVVRVGGGFITVWDGTINLLAQPHVADTLVTSDGPILAPLGLPTWLVTAAETLTLTDPTTLVGLTLRTSTVDPVPLLEAITTTGLRLLSTTAETITLSDTSNVIRALEGVLQFTTAETIILTDITTFRGLMLVTSAVETLPFSDVPIVIRAAAAPPQVLAAEPLTLTDVSLVRGLLLRSVVSDTLTLVEVNSGQLRPLQLSRVESVTLNDVAQLALTFPIVTTPLLHFTLPGRAMTVAGTVEQSTFAVPGRAMGTASVSMLVPAIVPGRSVSVEGLVAVSRYLVPSREMSVAA